MRNKESLITVVGLATLALLAAFLSIAALLHTRPTTLDAAPVETSTPGASVQKTPLPSATPSSQPDPQETTASPGTPGTIGPVAVVLGDRHSRADLDPLWVEQVATELGWSEVVNLSDPGRGYQAAPEECSAVDTCANFSGTIDAVVAADPDLVVTFGGTADGDYDMTEQITSYYTALRRALPDAELIAISPVTSADEAEYWLTMHARNIENAVTSVGGTFVDVGQPGVGDGAELSAPAQAELADAIIDALS